MRSSFFAEQAGARLHQVERGLSHDRWSNLWAGKGEMPEILNAIKGLQGLKRAREEKE
jgi:hypothetical protein